MRNFLGIGVGLTVAALAGSWILHSENAVASGRGAAEFFCGEDEGTPATIAQHPSRGEVVFVRWTRNYGNFTPERRCSIVSQKFESNQKSGNLNFIVPGWADVWTAGRGYPVLCASKKKPTEVIGCPSDRILMTLRKNEDDPKSIVKHLGEINRNNTSGGFNHVKESGLEESGEVLIIDTALRLNYAPLKLNDAPPRRIWSTESDCLFGDCSND